MSYFDEAADAVGRRFSAKARSRQAIFMGKEKMLSISANEFKKRKHGRLTKLK